MNSPATGMPSPDRQPSLQACALSKSFLSGVVSLQVLSELSISILPGELTLIAGPSGCGKSTLLSLLSGLQQPDAGRVVALGHDLSAVRPRELEHFRLQHTGFVFQGFNLFSSLTALEQVELPLRYLSLSRRETREKAMVALAEVGLASRIHMRPAEMSGGERQRVAIARAIAKNPRLLFADEPTSALDAVSGQVVIDILHRVALEHGTTVLCVSHDPRLIRHADRVLAMEDGLIGRDWRSERHEVDDAELFSRLEQK
ncbi:MAG TPA: ABC transporter ATP-binding protein [Moraxellaceae bacterium]|nr:ABC transporter ATP-binding protein [Moraxellaceae bacterium]